MEGFSFSNLSWIEEAYQKFLAHPEDVTPSWRYFFEGWNAAQALQSSQEKENGDLRIYRLIEAYRTYGHLYAKTNPILLSPAPLIDELKIETYGFSSADLNKSVPTFGFLKEKTTSLKNLLTALQTIYCKTMGFEYKGLRKPDLETWIEQHIESTAPKISKEEQLRIMDGLNKAEIFETVLHTKYTGQKRFSLEGEETLIPLLMLLLDTAAEEGLTEVIMGMAHRGRLNVLTNILNKPYEAVFYQFEGSFEPDLDEGVGDVKYHYGFEGSFKTPQGKDIHVVLAANPSHLESVNPVVEGLARAKQEILGHQKVLPLLIHGDAAIAGQGIVYETLQMANLNGYKTGGTIHIVVNNQIGFTTIPKDYQSTQYPTDIAKAFGAPVFHVNAECPEECVFAAKLAVAIRQKFGCDVFINLNGFRKYGHNEGDEPAFTQPLQYQLIRSKKSQRNIYEEALVQAQVLDAAQAKLLEEEFRQKLQKLLSELKPSQEKKSEKPVPDPFPVVQTAVSSQTLKNLALDFCTPPHGWKLHPKVEKMLQQRMTMMEGNIDWGMAEHLAFASLLAEGIPVRLSGEDSRRGTFSHRHAALTDLETEKRYYPLSHLKGATAKFDVYNSLLSEAAVLGFEFGYTIGDPRALVIWEAQYGDFANGAQIQIDQYIVASELRWGQKSRLVLFLPHGYEGSGAEHSSARLERFLQLAGNDNIVVAICSTTGQLFHLLRRQVLTPLAKPLILMTHKSLLRSSPSFSSCSQFSEGTFEEFIDDSLTDTRRVLFCSGRIYYDLITARADKKEVSIVRIEQLYPFHRKKFEPIAKKYQNAEWVWVQEEPKNMGAWNYIRSVLEEFHPVKYIGRAASGVPATGSYAQHERELQSLLKESFG